MMKFAKPPMMVKYPLLCAVTAIPRWRTARAIEWKELVPVEDAKGVARAMEKCLADCNKILRSSIPLVMYIDGIFKIFAEKRNS